MTLPSFIMNQAVGFAAIVFGHFWGLELAVLIKIKEETSSIKQLKLQRVCLKDILL